MEGKLWIKLTFVIWDKILEKSDRKKCDLDFHNATKSMESPIDQENLLNRQDWGGFVQKAF